ncbi:Crp/Fnr family transcriptional regulator [uncultured Bacteroides sp.]|uniref:Crp/Fnr family transcriptional regulator n=1 Tax=uncultured Bacteroides sp. TaxID=162156 RepID=UPI002AAC2E1A|nr:Crp/Fnr family transcriptional regulator [uncultured Bacteroides sp.]
METMYKTLLQMPLFQGLGEDEVTRIIGKVKLHFQKFKAGSVVRMRGYFCNDLTFLLKGELMLESTDKNNNFVIKEFQEAPSLVEFYSIFGLNANYFSTYTAETDVDLVSIDKSYILTELDKYDIFRLNFRNILSNRAQQLHDRLWQINYSCLETKMIDFLLARCERPFGKKLLKIKMEDFALIIGETRLSVSKYLNNLEKEGLIILRRTEVEIPDLYLLKLWKEKYLESLSMHEDVLDK